MTTREDNPQRLSGQLTAALSAGKQLPNGTVLAGRFRIVQPVGIGGQAHVYAARDEILGTEIAIKLIAPQHALDFEQVQRLRQEVLVARELNHPNIVRVFEFYRDGDWVFLTMGLIEGRSLAEYLHEGITRLQAETWSRQLLQALEACHSLDITHADVKPENILIDERGNLVLLDFGIGHIGEQSNRDFAGSDGYKAPEVTQLGKRNILTDSYSSGRLIADLVAAANVRAWHFGDLIWRLDRLRLARQLSKPLVYQRITVQAAQERLAKHPQRRIGIAAAVGFALILAVTYAFLLQPNIEEQPLQATAQKTTRIAVVYQPDDALLSGVAELLQLNLITQSGIDVIEQERVDTLMRNLGLRPFRQQDHRLRIAQLLNADVLVLLQSNELMGQEEPRLQMLMAEMPGNRLFGAFQGTIGSNGLGQTVEQLFAHLNSQLALPTRSSSVRPEELQRVEPVLTALREGRAAEAESVVQSLQEEWPDFPGGWLAGARLAVNLGDMQRAREQLERLYELSQDDDYWYLEGRALQAEINGDVETAIIVTNRLQELFPGRPSLMDRRAELAIWQDDFDTAIAQYQQALAIDPSSGERWFQLARLRIIQGNIQQALDNELTQALIRYLTSEDLRGQGTVLNAFGVAYIRLADPDNAIRYLQDALQLRTFTRDPSGRAVSLANLASVFGVLGRYEEAEAALAEALDIFQMNADRSGLAQVENEWGVLLEEQGRYREALVHYRNALDLHLQTGSTMQQAETISNVAYMHFLMADFSQSDVFWNQALVLFNRTGDETGILRTKLNLAQLGLSRGDFLSATTHLSEVLQRADQKRPAEGMIAQFLLSHRNFYLGNYDTSAENIETALRFAEEIGDMRAQIEILIWAGERCIYIADVQCLLKRHAQLDKFADVFSAEQGVMTEWIIIASDFIRGESSSSEIAAFWSRFRKQLLPVQTELKVLLSLLELQRLPADSWQWQRVDELVRPTLYREYMHSQYLKALHFGSEQASEQLQRMLQIHPEHWRNHLYYAILTSESAQARAQELREQLYESMTPDQIEAYQRIYERHETLHRGGDSSAPTQSNRATRAITSGAGHPARSRATLMESTGG
ncbi:MAG: tetratricopeptide repeat protein [Gammaproteobacteria bacterium]|nr:tetratricopeptide repeat protein [Gammaproteobacteria bacterium]